MAWKHHALADRHQASYIVGEGDECWIWTGSVGNHGYGVIGSRGERDMTTVLAHRVAYEFAVGNIPPGQVIDHLCRTPLCVNPTHLEAVSITENVLRGVGAGARNAKATHCPQGHEYTEKNTYSPPGKTHRLCRKCRYERNKIAAERRKNKSIQPT